MLKTIIVTLPLLLIFGLQNPAFSNDFKDPNRVILFDLPLKTPVRITYGNLKKVRKSKLIVDKCGTVVLKASKLRLGGRFSQSNTYIIDGDDKTSMTVTATKADLNAQQNSIDWNTVESTNLKYSCLNGVINPNITPYWVQRGGLRFFKYGPRDSQGEKLYITGLPYSTIRLSTPEDPRGEVQTRTATSDKCGVLVIRNNKNYPNNSLGTFTVTSLLGGFSKSYNYSEIQEILDPDKLNCNRYTK